MGLHKANKTSYKKGLKAKNWNGFKKGLIPWNKGLKGIQAGENGANWKGGLPNCENCGKQLSQRHPKVKLCIKCFCNSEIGKQQAISNLPKPIYGKEHWNWRGGKGTIRHRLRGQKEYILWRIAVFTRDDYTCQICGIRGKYMEADHIKPWALYPKLRYAIDNGRTLCLSCHRQTDTWGAKLLFRQVERVNG